MAEAVEEAVQEVEREVVRGAVEVVAVCGGGAAQASSAQVHALAEAGLAEERLVHADDLAPLLVDRHRVEVVDGDVALRPDRVPARPQRRSFVSHLAAGARARAGLGNGYGPKGRAERRMDGGGLGPGRGMRGARHRAGVLDELVRAHHAHVLDALDGLGRHVGREARVAVDGEPLLERELEPVTARDAVARPVVEVLVRDDALHALEVGVGRGRLLGEHAPGGGEGEAEAEAAVLMEATTMMEEVVAAMMEVVVAVMEGVVLVASTHEVLKTLRLLFSIAPMLKSLTATML